MARLVEYHHVATLLRHVGSILAAGLLLTNEIGATRRPQSSTLAASLDGALSAAVARGDVPGLVASAATRERILYRGAFGKADVGRRRPMTAEAVFRIASMRR